jgi:hypothetical protein
MPRLPTEAAAPVICADRQTLPRGAPHFLVEETEKVVDRIRGRIAVFSL